MQPANRDQIERWNGRVGAKWAALQSDLDAMLADATAELIASAGPVDGLRVLDIGCGTGVTCVAWLQGGADVTGVDVSAPMLANAAIRCNGRARLIRADAAEWRSDQRFDLAVSQFGVMFFDAPESAFHNIAANLLPGGRLLFVCWRALAENDWSSAPMQAIADLLPASEPELPHAPGPFAFGDAARLTAVLQRAGFHDVQCRPFDFPVYMARRGGAEAALRLLSQIGPASVAMSTLDEQVKTVARERLLQLVRQRDVDGQVSFPGAAWIVSAHR